MPSATSHQHLHPLRHCIRQVMSKAVAVYEVCLARLENLVDQNRSLLSLHLSLTARKPSPTTFPKTQRHPVDRASLRRSLEERSSRSRLPKRTLHSNPLPSSAMRNCSRFDIPCSPWARLLRLARESRLGRSHCRYLGCRRYLVCSRTSYLLV